MIKGKLLLSLTVCCILVAGCAESRILERISLVTLVGYDRLEKAKITTTSVIRQINPELESNVEVQSETESTSKGTRIKVDMQTAKKIAAGQLRVVLFGEEMAKEGIEELIHTLIMNNEISTSVYLATTRGPSKALLEYQYQHVKDIGQHIYNMIDHNIQQQHTISSTIHEVVRDNYSEVRNFAVPILAKEGEYVQLDGIAFFNSGKMVGELPPEDVNYIIMLMMPFDNGTLELSFSGESVDKSVFGEEELRIAIDSIKTKRKLSVSNADAYEFDVNIKLDCRLLEISSLATVSNPKVLKNIEKAMDKKIEKELHRVLQYSQKVNSDIYGFGEQYKSRVRDVKLTEKLWSEKFPEIKVNINVESTIIRNGVFE